MINIVHEMEHAIGSVRAIRKVVIGLQFTLSGRDCCVVDESSTSDYWEVDFGAADTVLMHKSVIRLALVVNK